MKKHISIVLLVTILLILNSCASYYLPINADQYVDTETKENEVTFDYQYDVLKLSENPNYTIREKKSGIQVLSVEIRNQTNAPISLFKDFELTREGIPLDLIPPLETYELLRRNKSVFLWWMVLALFSTTLESAGFTVTLPIGLVAGVIFTARNYRKASKSNDRLLRNLIDNDLMEKVVNPGEKVTGIVAFKDSQQRKLSLVRK